MRETHCILREMIEGSPRGGGECPSLMPQNKTLEGRGENVPFILPSPISFVNLFSFQAA